MAKPLLFSNASLTYNLNVQKRRQQTLSYQIYSFFLFVAKVRLSAAALKSQGEILRRQKHLVSMSIFNRPGVVGAVLQTPPLLIN